MPLLAIEVSCGVAVTNGVPLPAIETSYGVVVTSDGFSDTLVFLPTDTVMPLFTIGVTWGVGDTGVQLSYVMGP